MNNPLTRTTVLETHPSWKAHNMNASLNTASEGYADMELTGGFPPEAPGPLADYEARKYDGAGRTEAGQCRHASRYWEGVSAEASERFTTATVHHGFKLPMSDANATADARRMAPGYFRHP